jgi:predicted membrane channel-forming protein YqfA (hemolysin III family)
VPDEQRDEDDLDRELIELLNELRIALPGVQVLFAFLLAVPFANGWEKVDESQKYAFMVALLGAALGTVLLMSPTTYHRIRWREHDKEQLLRTSNRLAIAGTVCVAIGMTAAVYLVTDIVFSAAVSAVVTAAIAVVFAWFWYGLPLWRRFEKS